MPVDYSKYGGSSSPSDTKSKNKISSDYSKYKTKESDPNARPVIPSRMLPDAPSLDIMDSPLMQAVTNQPSESRPGRVLGRGAVEMEEGIESNYDRQKREVREIPVLKQILTGGKLPVMDNVFGWKGNIPGLDDIAQNKILNKIGGIGREFYIPGGSVSNIAALTGIAERGVAKAIPSLGNSALGRIGQKAASEAIVGAPLGVAQTQMVNPDATTKELLEGGAWGVAGGAVLGGLGKSIGEARKYDRDTAESFANNAFRSSTEPTLALPLGRGDARFNAAMGRSNLAPNEGPIFADGRVKQYEPLGLPEPNIAEPTRARVETRPNEYTRKLENLFEVANQQKFTPGKELEELESLWSQMAGPKDPSLNELIDLAYPKVVKKVGPNTLSKARDLQRSREVAGVPNKVKGLDDRYQPFVGDAGLPRERVGFGSPDVEIIPPKRRFPKKEVKTPVIKQDATVAKLENPKPQEPPTPKERSNYSNQRDNGNFSDDFNKEQSKRDLTYEPITNKETVDAVNEDFSKRPQNEIEDDFMRPKKELTAQHVATGYRLIQKLDQSGNYEKAVDVAEKLAADLTAAGQTVQAAKIIKRLSPEGQLLQLTREATKNGKTVKPKDVQKFMENAKVRQESSSSGPETAQFYDLLDRMKAGEKVSTDELQASVNKMLEEAKQAATPVKAPKEVKPRVRDKVLTYLEKEAKAAMEELRMKNNLGFARKVGTPDVVLWSKVMAHELAKKAVNIADFTELLVKQAGESIRPHAKAIYEGANKLIGKADKITVDKVKILDKFLKEGTFKPEDEKALREIAKQLDTLKGKKGLEADMEMQKILNKYDKSSIGAKLATMRYIAMLWNTGTQAVNTISGPMMMTYNYIIKEGIGTLIDMMTPGKRSTTMMQGPKLWNGHIQTLMDWFKGYGTGWKSGWHGVDPEGIASQHDIRGLSFKSLYNPLGLLERSLGAVAKSADFATFNATRNMEMRKIAYLDAKNSGVKGKEAIRAHMDKFMADPPQKALEQATRQGKKVTFQNTDGLAGGAANAARNIDKTIAKYTKIGSEHFGPAKTVAPFIRTPLNIAISGVENTPAGIFKGLVDLKSLLKGSDEITKREVLQTFVSATAGGAALGGLGYFLSSTGVITGDYSSKKTDVKGLEDSVASGKFKFNTTAFDRVFKVLFSGDMEKIKQAGQYQKGDKQVDYNKLQPLALPVAAGATLQQNKDKPLTERIDKAAGSSLSSLFGMSALQGLQQVFQPDTGATDEDIPKGIFRNLAESAVKSFSPSVLAQEARRQDPLQRQTSFKKGFTKDVSDYYKSRLPENILGVNNPFNSKTLPEKVTNLGDVKQNPKGIIGNYLNPLRSEEPLFNDAAKIIYDAIGKTGDEKLAPTPMKKTIRGTKKGEKLQSSVTLDTQRFTKLQQDTGKEISKRIIALAPDKRTDKNIEKIYTDVRAKMREAVKKEYGFKVE